MKLIVGLGNPGNEYRNTRHNMGFMAIDNYVNTNKLGLFKEKFSGEYLDTNINGERVIFLKPLTYMNLSGDAVSKYMSFFKIDISDLFVICDDLDMPLGKLKLKQSSSSGGHNGLKSIEHNLSSNKYKRLKLGIGNNKKIDTKDYVLGRFNEEDLFIIKKEMSTVNEIINDYLVLDFDKLMNKYNKKDKEVNND